MMDHEESFAPAIPRSGLTLWLRSDRILGLNDGDPIAIWPDLSGNGNHATQNTPSAQPIYKASIVNGRPVVRFSGSVVSGLYTPSITLGSTLTIFLVAQSSQVIPPGPNRYFLTYGGASVIFRSQSTSDVNSLLNPTGGSATYVQIAPDGHTAWFIAGTRFDGATYQVFLNGTPGATAANTGMVSGAAVIGSGDTGIPPTCDVAEVLVYTRALLDAERRRVERILGHRWGIAVG